MLSSLFSLYKTMSVTYKNKVHPYLPFINLFIFNGSFQNSEEKKNEKIPSVQVWTVQLRCHKGSWFHQVVSSCQVLPPCAQSRLIDLSSFQCFQYSLSVLLQCSVRSCCVSPLSMYLNGCGWSVLLFSVFSPFIITGLERIRFTLLSLHSTGPKQP